MSEYSALNVTHIELPISFNQGRVRMFGSKYHTFLLDHFSEKRVKTIIIYFHSSVEYYMHLSHCIMNGKKYVLFFYWHNENSDILIL